MMIVRSHRESSSGDAHRLSRDRSEFKQRWRCAADSGNYILDVL